MHSEESAHPISYHGDGASHGLLILKNIVLSLVTLGLYGPWAKTAQRRYIIQNYEIAGHRFVFTGTGKELFIGLLKILALYAAFFGFSTAVETLPPALMIPAHLVLAIAFLALIGAAIYGALRYKLSRTQLRGIRFGLIPGARGFLIELVVGYLLTVVTLGLYAPVMGNRLYKYIVRNAHYGSMGFNYTGDSRRIFLISLKGLLLSILTMGIYLPWFLAEFHRYRLSNTWIGTTQLHTSIRGLGLLRLLLLQALGMVLTLGLAFPWIMTASLRYFAENVWIDGDVDFDAIEQRASEGGALSEGAAGFFDLDMGL